MGNPVPQNFVYLNARMLLERVAPVMIDREAIESLMDFTEEIIHDRNDATMRVENAIGKSMELLQVRYPWFCDNKCYLCFGWFNTGGLCVNNLYQRLCVKPT